VIGAQWIGRELGSSVLLVERGRLKFFAKAMGETNPIYFDEAAAKAAGYADVPAPPTFLFAADLDSGLIFNLLDQMGVALSKVLHGEQSFEYFAPVVAGDVITFKSTIKNIYSKRAGALEFIELEGLAVNQQGESVARTRNVTVVRN
jgi:acyl dehydratase